LRIWTCRLQPWHDRRGLATLCGRSEHPAAEAALSLSVSAAEHVGGVNDSGVYATNLQVVVDDLEKVDFYADRDR
jgi:hypothetical protein